jgi:nitrate reductase cytochrome c-type subunit
MGTTLNQLANHSPTSIHIEGKNSSPLFYPHRPPVDPPLYPHSIDLDQLDPGNNLYLNVHENHNTRDKNPKERTPI